MRRLLTILTVLVVLGLVVGAYFFGRDHAVEHSSSTTTPPHANATTPSTIPATSIASCNGQCSTLADSAGDSISVTLKSYLGVYGCNSLAANGGGSDYLVALSLYNSGKTILTTASDSYEQALTLIDTSSTPYTTNGGSCGYQGAPAVLSECHDSAYIVDLTPGARATWCPLVTFPTTSTLATVQFDASQFFSAAFTQSGINNTITWDVGSP